MNGERTSGVLTIQQLRELKDNLEHLLQYAETSRSTKKYRQVVHEAELFINECEKVICWGTSQDRKDKAYTERTVNMLEEWADTWTDINAHIAKENLSARARIALLLSGIGQFRWCRRKREYTDNDLPRFPKDITVSESKPNGEQYLTPHRDYTDDDLPTYLPSS